MDGPEPPIHEAIFSGRHGWPLHGMWHQRMVQAWHKAWANSLIDQVVYHGGDLYTVPSTSEPEKWYAVHHFRLAPDGYLWICDCAASEKGGRVCQHAFAAYLWRLENTFGWRLKVPQ